MSEEHGEGIQGRSLKKQGLLDDAWRGCTDHSDLILPDYKEVFLLMMRVWLNEPTQCYMTALSDGVRGKLKVDAKTAVARIRRLVDIKLFVTMPSDVDRRRILVIPTQESLRIVAKYDVATDAVFQLQSVDDTLSRRA